MEEKKKTGRPEKVIDRKQFESLCALQCTLFEVCSFFDVTDKTLSKWCHKEYGMSFSEVFAIKRGAGQISLRRSQFKLAEQNAAMAIWLGKQYLEQKDVVEVTDPEAFKRAREILEGVESVIN